MALKNLECFRAQGLQELGFALLKDHRYLLFCSPEQTTLNAALTTLISYYAERENRPRVSRITDGRTHPRGRQKEEKEKNTTHQDQNPAYLIVCPGYAKQPMVELLEGQLTPTTYDVVEMDPDTELEDELYGNSDDSEGDKTKVVIFGTKAFYNRVVKIGTRGLGVNRIILIGFLAGLLSQEWQVYSNIITELAKLKRRCPRVTWLIQHGNPELFQWWLENLKFEVTLVGRTPTGMATINRTDRRVSWVIRQLEREEKLFCVYSTQVEKKAGGRMVPFGAPVRRTVEVAVVDGHNFHDPLEVGRIAHELGRDGQILLVNCGREKAHWLIQGAVGLPSCSQWYFDRIHDFVLEFHRRSRTKKEFRQILKDSFPGYYLQKIPQLLSAYHTESRTRDQISENYPLLRELLWRYKEATYAAPWKYFITEATHAWRALRDAGCIRRKRYRSKEERLQASVAGKFSCSSFGALIAATPYPAKECLQRLEQYGGKTLRKKERAAIIEQLIEKGTIERRNKPGRSTEPSPLEKKLTVGQMVRQSHRTRWKSALKYGKGRPRKPEHVGQMKERRAKRRSGQQKQPWERRALFPGRVRFKKAVEKLILALHKRITTPIRGTPGRVEVQRWVWYQTLAREEGIPERSVHYLLSKYFMPKQVEALIKQFGGLPRGALLVLRAIHFKKVRVGPYAPILVIVCRVKSGGLQEAGRTGTCKGCPYQGRGDQGCVLETEDSAWLREVVDPGGWPEAVCLASGIGEGHHCGDCGLYTPQDWGCAVFCKLAEESPSNLPTGRFMSGRARQGRHVRNREACGWFVPRVQAATIPRPKLQEAWWFGTMGIIHGWRCPRIYCEGILPELPEVGRVVVCPECGAKFVGRMDGSIRMEVDFEAEIKRLVKFYSGIEPELPGWDAKEREFVLVTWDCKAHIDGAQLIVNYPKHTGTYDLDAVYVTVHGKKELAKELEARGVPYSYKEIPPPKHETPSVEFWRAILNAKPRYEEFRRKYFWGLLINHVLTTAALSTKLDGSADRPTYVDAQFLKILRFLKRERFDRLFFIAIEGRVSQELHHLIRTLLNDRWPDSGVVREDIGRTFGRKGDRMYTKPTRAAGAKTMLDAALNRTGKVLTNLVRAQGAEIGVGYNSVKLFSHQPKDRPELAAALDLREPLVPALWTEICEAFLEGRLTPEDFEAYQSARGFPRYAPTPQGSSYLLQLVEDFYARTVIWKGENGAEWHDIETVHRSSVTELLNAMEAQKPEQYLPFVLLPPEFREGNLALIERMQRLFVEFPREVEKVPDQILIELEQVLTGIAALLRRDAE